MFDDTNLVIQAAVIGVSLGLAFEEQVAELIMKRRLIRVLEDWCPLFPVPGFFLYPSRRNQPAGLAALINALRLS
jgi:DNA-binding transcriptional LysR family regulator